MTSRQALEFATERSVLLESICESKQTLGRIYSGKDGDTDIDKILYKWESERLGSILEDFEGLYTKYHLLLSLLPKKDVQNELCFVKCVVDEARKFIESAPRNLKECYNVVPNLERAELCIAEDVAPYSVEKVVEFVLKLVTILPQSIIKRNVIQ